MAGRKLHSVVCVHALGLSAGHSILNSPARWLRTEIVAGGVQIVSLKESLNIHILCCGEVFTWRVGANRTRWSVCTLRGCLLDTVCWGEEVMVCWGLCRAMPTGSLV